MTSPNIGSSSGGFDDDAPSSNSTPRRNAAPTASSTPGGAGAIEGRGKVAYDPRDFEDAEQAKTQPRLTLMEEILLLGLKDKAVRCAMDRMPGCHS